MREVLLGEPMRAIVEVGVAWRLRAERVDVRSAMAEKANALGQRRGRGRGGHFGRNRNLGGGLSSLGCFGSGGFALQQL